MPYGTHYVKDDNDDADVQFGFGAPFYLYNYIDYYLIFQLETTSNPCTNNNHNKCPHSFIVYKRFLCFC